MFGIGGGEILVVALVALILFGNEDLPKNMRKIVKAWNDFRGATNELQRSWLDVRDQVTRDLLTEQHSQPTALEPSVQPHPLNSVTTDDTQKNETSENAAIDSEYTAVTGNLSDTPSIQTASGIVAQGDFEIPAASHGLSDSDVETKVPATAVADIQADPAVRETDKEPS